MSDNSCQISSVPRVVEALELWNANSFGAGASGQVVVELVIDRFANEVDARIDHDEVRAARVCALEATRVGVALTAGWNRACDQGIQRNLSPGEREVWRPGTLIRALLRHCFTGEKRIAEPVGNLFEGANLHVSPEHAGRTIGDSAGRILPAKAIALATIIVGVWNVARDSVGLVGAVLAS